MIKKMTELEQITQDFKARKRALNKKVNLELLNLVKKSLEHSL